MPEQLTRQVELHQANWLLMHEQLLLRAAEEWVFPRITTIKGENVVMEDLTQYGYVELARLDYDNLYSPELVGALVDLFQRANAVGIVQNDTQDTNIMYNGEVATFVDFGLIDVYEEGKSEMDSFTLAKLLLEAYTEPFRVDYARQIAENSNIPATQTFYRNAASAKGFLEVMNYYNILEQFVTEEQRGEYDFYGSYDPLGNPGSYFFVLKFARSIFTHILENEYPEIYARINKDVLKLVFDVLENQRERYSLEDFIIDFP